MPIPVNSEVLPENMLSVIINADDFGMSEKVNSAIYDALDGIWITSATLLSGSPCVEQAVEMSTDFSHASFGAHLALSGDYNIGVKENSIIMGEKFHPSLIRKMKQFNMTIVNDIFTEYSLQIEKLLKLGVNISHVDTHHHLHLYFPALMGLIKAARQYDIKKVRSLSKPINQSFVKKAYRNLHSHYIAMNGFISPDFYCDFKEFKQLSGSLKEENTIEIMCHPGHYNDEHYNDEQYFNGDFYRSEYQGKLINYHNL